MHPYLILVIVFLVVFYLWDICVGLLNVRALRFELPAEFQGFYDQARYKTAQEYLRENTGLSLWQETFSLLLVLGFIFVGGFAAMDVKLRSLGWSEMTTGILFIGILGLLSSLLQLPFSIYSTFVIEAKYGFNKTTLKTFILDKMKGTLLSILIGVPILVLVLWFFQEFGDYAWVYAWLGLLAIEMMLLFLAPAFILPLFNKFEPLAAGELRDAIEAFARKLRFHVQGLFTMDGSKRSTKANAFFTGFGRFRRIVLFDTLIAKHTTPELVAILAHEIGHYKLRHIYKSLLLSILSSGALFYLLSLLINNQNLFSAFQMPHVSVYASLVFIAFLYTPISRIFSILGNILSRKHEFEADAFSAREYGQPEVMITALKKLSVENLSNLTPHPLKVFCEYSHPPVLERIRALRALS